MRRAFTLMEMVVCLALLMLIVPLVGNLIPLGLSSNRKAATLQGAGALAGVLIEEGVAGGADLVGVERVVGQNTFRCWRTSTDHDRVRNVTLRDVTVRVENPRIVPVKLCTRANVSSP